MNELLNHLTNDRFGSYYLDETTQLTEYGNLIAFVYVVLKRALDEDADRIEATTRTLTLSREAKVIYKIDDDVFGHTDYPSGYGDQMRKILAKDPIVRKWTRVISDTKAGIICEFLS